MVKHFPKLHPSIRMNRYHHSEDKLVLDSPCMAGARSTLNLVIISDYCVNIQSNLNLRHTTSRSH